MEQQVRMVFTPRFSTVVSPAAVKINHFELFIRLRIDTARKFLGPPPIFTYSDYVYTGLLCMCIRNSHVCDY
jgi:hypothetical protein